MKEKGVSCVLNECSKNGCVERWKGLIVGSFPPRGPFVYCCDDSCRLAGQPAKQPTEDHLTGQLAFRTRSPHSCVSGTSNSGSGVGEHGCENKKCVACCGKATKVE